MMAGSRRLAVLLACLSSALPLTAGEYTEEDGVVVLEDSTFQSFVSSRKFVLVEFFAPWCGHCKELTPKWVEAAKQAKALDTPVPLAKVDATANEETASKFDVTGYPTIKLFVDGKPQDFSGQREVDAIVSFLRKHVSFSLPQLSSASELTDLVTKSGTAPVVLGLFRMPLAASQAFQTFKSAAFEFTDQPVVTAYSASYATPPVLPLTSDGKKPAVPGLVLVGRDGTAAQTLPVPRKKEDFTIEYITTWLSGHGVQMEYTPPEEEYDDKEYSPDEGEESYHNHYGDDHYGDGDEDDHFGDDDVNPYDRHYDEFNDM